MDSELKELLAKLLAKVEDMEKRLKVVESKAHDQVSPTIVIREQPAFQWPHYETTPNPVDHRYMTIC